MLLGDSMGCLCSSTSISISWFEHQLLLLRLGQLSFCISLYFVLTLVLGFALISNGDMFILTEL